MQRNMLSHPIVGLQRGRSRFLLDVQCRAFAEYGDIDSLTGVPRELPDQRSCFADDVEPGRGGAGQSDDTDTESVSAAFGALFDEASGRQRRDEPERRRLVDTELTGNLGHSGLPGPSQDFQNGDRSID